MNIVLINAIDNNPPVMEVFRKTVGDLSYKLIVRDSGGDVPIADHELDMVISGYPIESAFEEAGDACQKRLLMKEAKLFYLSGFEALQSTACLSSRLAFPIDSRVNLLLAMSKKLELFLPPEEAINIYRNVVSSLAADTSSEEVSSTEQQVLCNVLNEVGLRLLYLGGLDEGLIYVRRALLMRKKLLIAGLGWPRLLSLADWYERIAKKLADLREDELAEEFLREALVVVSQMPTEGLAPMSVAESQAQALHNLGVFLVGKGKAEGCVCLEQAVKLGGGVGVDSTLSQQILDEHRARFAA